ncbi:MAG: efflux RND transporter periplasmic adaptor subunit [Geobacter sp.]|nr:efflux RND transporter periplasmic adaptor subunit [Geobacter sp.]
MSLSRKITILVALIALVAVAGGAYYYFRHAGHDHAAEKSGTAAQGKVQYTCPMHPFIIKDQPGTCPICGMDLVKKVEGAEGTPEERARLGEIALSPTQQVIANVATVKVNREPLTREIQAVGIVQYDQSRQAKVTAWVAGRLDRLYVDAVGETVSRGRPVAEVYSPELVAAQQEYLLALKSREQLKDSSIAAISQGGEGLVASARQRLKLMGVKDAQIADLERSGEATIRLAIYTPISGVVIEKLVQQGQYVNLGDPLFNVADLSRIWVDLDIFESDLALVKVGQRAEITAQSYPGRTFSGRVALVNPFLDPKTRTVKVRVELANPGLILKPDMFVNARIRVPLGETLTVPVSALIDTGKRQVVWVRVKPGLFAPRDVEIGQRAGDKVQILKGLFRGDVVAASGGYLIDSEAQLSGGNKAEHAGHAAPSTPLEPGTDTRQKPAAPKGGLDMGDMKM